MEIVFFLSAERDLQEAYHWVEKHRQGRAVFPGVALKAPSETLVYDVGPIGGQMVDMCVKCLREDFRENR
jgi:hypothetical protein